MSITSFAFLCSFAAVLTLYYLIPKRVQWMFLLFVSILYFLTAGEPWLLFYPAAAITIVYAGALYIDGVKEQKKKKAALSLVVVFCLLMLIILKYCNFGIYTYNALAMRGFWGSGLLSTVQLTIPLGISFYTLALLGYLFDVYYEIAKPQRNFFKFALFGFYFPVIVSGPILRYRNMEEQLYAPHKMDFKQVTYGLQRMVWGFFKKLVIAERLALVVASVYGDYRTYSGFYIPVAVICFAFQLYADFSGGMDIVLGLSEALGIRVAENFRTPYFSRSIQEFWRRWHITLGEWLKDYLFYPLLRTDTFGRLQEICKKRFGKKTGKKLATFVPMFFLWFAVGMWHGGAWKFIVGSGLLHWCYIVGGELLTPLWKRIKVFFHLGADSLFLKAWQQLRTFLLVCAGFLFFRAESFSEGCRMYAAMFFTWNPHILWDGSLLTLGLDAIEAALAVVALIVLLIVSVLQQKEGIRDRIARRNIVIRWVIWYALLFGVILFGYYGPEYSAAEFIYQGF
ncbi:MAG: MBOAT family protein [Lachnospiraceae bacterium]|nr:MBOAT family protein [Lachnospiraceae bacterium]